MTTEYPYFYEGKWCRICDTYRSLYGPGKGRKRFGNRYIVRFEDGTVSNIPAGKFNTNVGKNAPASNPEA